MAQMVKVDEAFVHVKDLTFAHRQSWKFTGGSAELIGGHTLKVGGNYCTETLKEGTYEVNFEVMLKNSFNIKTPVKVTLTLPDGTVQETEEHLMLRPRNERIWVKAGEFSNETPGEIKFVLSGTECDTWKQGLVIDGVLIALSDN